MNAESEGIRDMVALDADSMRSYIDHLDPSPNRAAPTRASVRCRAPRRSCRAGVTVPPTVEGRIVENTLDVFHLTLPPDPHGALSDEGLSMVAGSKTAGSAESASS